MTHIEPVPATNQPPDGGTVTLTKTDPSGEPSSHTVHLAFLDGFDLLEMGAEIENENRTLTQLLDLVKQLVHNPDEYEALKAWSKSVSGDINDVSTWLGELFEQAVGGVPTEGQSTSSDGLPETSDGSTVTGEPVPVTDPQQGSAV